MQEIDPDALAALTPEERGRMAGLAIHTRLPRAQWREAVAAIDDDATRAVAHEYLRVIAQRVREVQARMRGPDHDRRNRRI